MSDVLKKPVHVAILKPTHMQKLAEDKRIPDTACSVSVPKTPDLPSEKEVKPYDVPKLNLPTSDLIKKSKKQLNLRIYYDKLPPLPKDKVPPCESCKTSACCVAFVVNITKDEYESGLYGDAAVEFTPEIQAQLKSPFLKVAMLGSPVEYSKSAYYLDGKRGEPCPFLNEKNQCGIYDIRPVTCRMYTCVGDSRITPEMRDGTAKLDLLSLMTGNSTDAK
jgi:Fe-S-cluster containining protein